jgi:hypothetical protein
LGGREAWVVSREGLIYLKSLRSSGQDLDDIQKLKESGKGKAGCPKRKREELAST